MSSNGENDEHQADLLSQEEEPEKLNVNKNKGDESSL